MALGCRGSGAAGKLHQAGAPAEQSRDVPPGDGTCHFPWPFPSITARFSLFIYFYLHNAAANSRLNQPGGCGWGRGGDAKSSLQLQKSPPGVPGARCATHSSGTR